MIRGGGHRGGLGGRWTWSRIWARPRSVSGTGPDQRRDERPSGAVSCSRVSTAVLALVSGKLAIRLIGQDRLARASVGAAGSGGGSAVPAQR